LEGLVTQGISHQSLVGYLDKFLIALQDGSLEVSLESGVNKVKLNTKKQLYGVFQRNGRNVAQYVSLAKVFSKYVAAQEEKKALENVMKKQADKRFSLLDALDTYVLQPTMDPVYNTITSGMKKTGPLAKKLSGALARGLDTVISSYDAFDTHVLKPIMDPPYYAVCWGISRLGTFMDKTVSAMASLFEPPPREQKYICEAFR